MRRSPFPQLFVRDLDRGARAGKAALGQAAGQWNRVLAVDVRDNVGDGSADGGVGILMTGGNAKIEIKAGLLRNNHGSGLRVLAPPVGQSNGMIVLAGNSISGNGSGAQRPHLAVVDG